LPLIVATVLFAFQIYCDFSAYSDIAIGTARVMGFSLMQNFRQPYLARSVREFWARWHISLSTWFRDYLYIPLGGNRISKTRTLINMFIIFLVSGLWHGAAWTFVVWGALHGVFVVIETVMTQYGIRLFRQETALTRAMQRGGTFALVLVAWVFFRANSFEDALHIFTHAHLLTDADILAPFAAGALLPLWLEMALSVGLIGLLLWVDSQANNTGGLRLPRMPLALRWATYYAMGAAVLFSGLYGAGAQQFIYFQF
jgi:D-alanyl-lipoteichoic acid acyltransferase DltB (MBOAT superfamily)